MQVDSEKGLTRSKVLDVEDKSVLTAKMLSGALSGTYKERMEEEKTIIVKYTPGRRPDVFFTGFWNGTFIKAVLKTLPRAYRLHRREAMKARFNADNTPDKGEGGKAK